MVEETFLVIFICKHIILLLSGDTIDRLSTVHDLLAEATDWPRVVHCAQVVPVLLHIYFNTVVKVRGS